VFSFNKKHKKMLGKCLICAMTIFPRSAILLWFTGLSDKNEKMKVKKHKKALLVIRGCSLDPWIQIKPEKA
jgi:hypothetical protein